MYVYFCLCRHHTPVDSLIFCSSTTLLSLVARVLKQLSDDNIQPHPSVIKKQGGRRLPSGASQNKYHPTPQILIKYYNIII